MKELLLDSSRILKQTIASTVDFLCILVSLFAVEIFLESSSVIISASYFLSYVVISLISVFIFYILGIYNLILRFVDITFVYLIIKAILISSLFNLALSWLVSSSFLIPVFRDFSKFLLFTIFLFNLLVVSRVFAIYFFKRRNHDRRVVIYGAGSAGIQLASALKVSSEMKPIAFVDENKSLHGSYVGGLKIFDPNKLRSLLRKKHIDEVLIAIPSASKNILSKLLKRIEQYSVKVRILPGLSQVAQGKVSVSELKEVDISDLLGRYEVEADLELLNKNTKDKSVLITGAGGSIGSEITRQVVHLNPKVVVILDANEYALYQIKQEIQSIAPHIRIESIIGNVTNKARIKTICEAFGVDTVYHTAAYKHVPLVEENPFEGVINNILGTKSCLEASLEAKVETFVLISTDKAVRPTNIMGATKRFAELILQAYSADPETRNKTRMIMVRFGNVLGSSGSAVPLFQKQIKEGGPVTVTHPEVIRYFMSIPEASELVIQAGAMGTGGDVFVLDMGNPVKIFDLAKRLINLNGLELKDDSNSEGDIEIVFTGLRPGEKLYEELLIGNNVSKTDHEQILRAKEDHLSRFEIDSYLDSILRAEKEGDVLALKNILKEAVKGFTSDEGTVDAIYLQRNNH